MHSRLRSLDGFRSVAIALVFLVHAYPNTFPGAFAGVDLFFVLSGFLITSILLREYEDSGTISISAFYMRRFLRLFPALALIVVLYGILTYFVLDAKTDHYKSMAYAFYVMNYVELYSLQNGYLGHTWTLAIEEQFYLVWPFVLFMLLSRFGRRNAAIAVALLIPSITLWRMYLFSTGSSSHRLLYGFDTHADTLLYGCLWALYPVAWLENVLSKFWVVPAAILAVFSLAASDASDWFSYFGVTLLSICGLWLIVALTSERASVLKSALSTKPLVLLGMISYGFYLWHLPLLAFTKNIIGRRSAEVALAFGLAVLAASLSFLFVERPFLRLKNRWEPRLRSRSMREPATASIAG